MSVSIKPRKMAYNFKALNKPEFFQDNPVTSAFMAALSATFPAGELEFIRTVRPYQARIEDPILQKMVKAFMGQEGHHSHQHDHLNQQLDKLGYNTANLNARLEKYLAKRNRHYNDKRRLAWTVAFEHLTAVMADYFLRHQGQYANVQQPFMDLILWHCVEEIEHKAVAFDVFMEFEDDPMALKLELLWVSFEFTRRFTGYTSSQLWHRKRVPSLAEAIDFGRFLLGRHGLITQTYKDYLAFFKTDFHPWDIDNRALIELWQQQQAAPPQKPILDQALSLADAANDPVAA